MGKRFFIFPDRPDWGRNEAFEVLLFLIYRSTLEMYRGHRTSDYLKIHEAFLCMLHFLICSSPRINLWNAIKCDSTSLTDIFP
jgi:hypothetical protein